MISRNSRMLMICITMLAASGTLTLAAPPRLVATPHDVDKVIIYAYKSEPLVSLKEESPGFLVEVVKEIVKHPKLPVVVDVTPAAILMKYSLIQSVGVGAIGMDSDFAGEDSKDLLGIPLYERDGKLYKLFLNKRNPEAEPLYAGAARLLEEIKANGTFDKIKTKYGLN